MRRESDGFIFSRIWASIKRECLMVVEEGVASPENVDRMWEIFTKPGVPPFRLMDEVGLDVVLNIEDHYAQCVRASPRAARALRKYINEGRLGMKNRSGFYGRQALTEETTPQEEAWTSQSSAPATWPAAFGHPVCSGHRVTVWGRSR